MSNIRSMEEGDRETVLDMMRRFYASDAVGTDGSEDIFAADFDACIGNSPHVDGFIIEDLGKKVGYAMIARSWSTEFGGRCIWIEDLFIEKNFRGRGLSSLFFSWLFKNEDAVLFRLEVEDDNKIAINSYVRNGFEFLNYAEMIRHGRQA